MVVLLEKVSVSIMLYLVLIVVTCSTGTVANSTRQGDNTQAIFLHNAILKRNIDGHHTWRYEDHQRYPEPVAKGVIQAMKEHSVEQHLSDDPLISTGITESSRPKPRLWKTAALTNLRNVSIESDLIPNATGSESEIGEEMTVWITGETGYRNGDLGDRVTSTTTGIKYEKEIESDAGYPQPMITFTTVLLVLMFSILLILTVIGNALVCLSLLFVKKLRKPQNYLIASLALSDLFVALFVMPFAIVLEVYEGQWPFNGEFCDFWVSGKYHTSTCLG